MQFPTSINKPLTINKLPEPVTFSSNTVLNNTYDLNLSPIPFCCILEPFFTPSSDVNNNNVQQPTTIIPMMEKKDFITCTNPKCKAYLNPFCKLDLKLKRWKCVFCANNWREQNLGNLLKALWGGQHRRPSIYDRQSNFRVAKQSMQFKAGDSSCIR